VSGFWSSVWSFFDVQSSNPYDVVVSGDNMPGATWFQGARLNYAERTLATTGNETVVLARSQAHGERRLSWNELRQLVGRWIGLVELGVG